MASWNISLNLPTLRPSRVKVGLGWLFDKKLPHIKNRKDFPEHSIGYEYYFELDNKYAFSDWNINASSKINKFSVTVAAKFTIEAICDQISHHLWMDRKTSMRWKGIQLMDTDKSTTLLGLDTNAFAEYVVHEVAVKIFEECEAEMHGDVKVKR